MAGNVQPAVNAEAVAWIGLAFSARDMSYVEWMADHVRLVTEALGIPPHMMRVRQQVETPGR